MTYSIECECANCNHVGSKEFDRGQVVPATFECPNCGCETATKKQVTKDSIFEALSKKREFQRPPKEHWLNTSDLSPRFRKPDISCLMP